MLGITGRAQAAKWYAELAKKDSIDTHFTLHAANTSHQYFLAILEQVFDILRKEHKRKAEKKVPVLASDINDLTNLYHHLQLEETATEADCATAAGPPLRPKKASGKPKQKDAYDLGSEKEETLFAIWCLFKDIFSIRLYTRSMWASYGKGEISLMVACKMTEKAIIMGRSLSRGFDQMHRGLNGFEKIIEFIGAADLIPATVEKSFDFEEERRSGKEHPELSVDNATDLLLAHPYAGIMEFREVQNYVWVAGADRRYGQCYPRRTSYGHHPFVKVLTNVALHLELAFPEMGSYMRDKTGTVPAVAQEILIQDDPPLHFDYYGFAKQCLNWLGQANLCFFKGSSRDSYTKPYRYGMVHSVL
jgi:hypothetical protein